MSGSRHESRILCAQALYADEFRDRAGVESFADSDSLPWIDHPDLKTKSYAMLLYRAVKENIEMIDDILSKRSKTRALRHVTMTDLAVLRLGAYSILFEKDMDSKVAIDESVKLSIEFSGGPGFKFVNGILDAIASDADRGGPSRSDRGVEGMKSKEASG